ncbi:MAG: nucleotidyltransferase [Planctomycetota bacterium]
MSTNTQLSVSTRFTKFLGNLAITTQQQLDGAAKHAGVRRVLNEHYWSIASSSANSMLVGSWGRSTEVRPPRDIDVLFVLPDAVYQRFEQVPSYRNKQSELLQEVKRVLGGAYSTTRMRGDGQVVVVDFTSYAVEVVPAFARYGGGYLICDTNGGGRYKFADPCGEMNRLRASNERTKGNTRDLVRMLKAWQRYCSVPIKSFHLELLAMEFLGSWEYAGNSPTYYDWMARDFFGFLLWKARGVIYAPGTSELILLGDDWASRAESARLRAVKACSAASEFEAGTEWRKIFGDDMPLLP